MTALSLAITALALAALVSPSTAAGIVFKPLRANAGQSIRLVTHSETPGGTIMRSLAGKVTNGTIDVTRDRELIWTFRNPSPDGTRHAMIRVPKITTTTTTTYGGNAETVTDTSPLSGKMFSMSRTPAGDWSFELDGSIPLARVRHEIEGLKVYLKRDWFPLHEVNLGDSWEFDPAWIKMTIEKDLAKAQTVGTMTLRQIRRSTTFNIAVIDVSVRSTGTKFATDGTESDGAVTLDGEVIVNLETMLDESLDLKGTIVTSNSTGLNTVKVTLPVHLTVKKSFVNGVANP